MDEKHKQLGMHHGTASNRLKKSIMLKLINELGLDGCHQCGKKIATEKELSIEHIVPWLHSDDPPKLFFDLNNIAFSHLICNSRSSRTVFRGPKSSTAHGETRYDKWGCRCSICRKAKSKRNAKRCRGS